MFLYNWAVTLSIYICKHYKSLLYSIQAYHIFIWHHVTVWHVMTSLIRLSLCFCWLYMLTGNATKTTARSPGTFFCGITCTFFNPHFCSFVESSWPTPCIFASVQNCVNHVLVLSLPLSVSLCLFLSLSLIEKKEQTNKLVKPKTSCQCQCHIKCCFIC